MESKHVNLSRAGANNALHAGSIFFTTNYRKMNHVNLIGKVCTAPRIYELPNGRKIARFTLQTSETYLDEEGNTKSRKYKHLMSAWGLWTKVLEGTGKNLELAIEGKLISRFYIRNGQKHFVSEVEVNDLIIL